MNRTVRISPGDKFNFDKMDTAAYIKYKICLLFSTLKYYDMKIRCGDRRMSGRLRTDAKFA